MIKSKLPNNVLGKIWKLSDVDRYLKCRRCIRNLDLNVLNLTIRYR